MEAIWSIQYGGKACVSINSIHVTYIFYIQPYINLVLHQQFEFNFEAYFNNRVTCMKLRVNSWYNPTSPEIYVGIPPPLGYDRRTPCLASALGPLACLAAALGPIACLAAALGPIAANIT